MKWWAALAVVVLLWVAGVAALPLKTTYTGTLDYWLWGGPVDHQLIDHAGQLYVLQGEVYRKPSKERATLIVRQGPLMPKAKPTPTWLVYRTNTLTWSPNIVQLMLDRIAQWRKADNHIVGIQIDFDASTDGLADYKYFLDELKSQLPADVRLSVTGLMDWTNRRDDTGINQLRGVVDEIVIQTYQGHHTIADAETYLKRLDAIKVPFKVGLIQRGREIQIRAFENNAYFRGYVIFPLPMRSNRVSMQTPG